MGETDESGSIPDCADAVLFDRLLLLFQEFNEAGIVA